WAFHADATVDGLALWFDSDIGGGQHLSAAPAADGAGVYRQLYLPFRNPVRVARGATMRAEVEVRLIQANYVWSWQAWLRSPGECAEMRVASQNSLAELVIDPTAMPQTTAQATPRFDAAAEALAYLIVHADGRQTVAD